MTSNEYKINKPDCRPAVPEIAPKTFVECTEMSILWTLFIVRCLFLNLFVKDICCRDLVNRNVTMHIDKLSPRLQGMFYFKVDHG